LHAFIGNVQQVIQAHTFDTRHGSDGLSAFLTLEHEDGVDEIIHAQGMFAHQAAREVVTA
jgi:hypothetical protein